MFPVPAAEWGDESETIIRPLDIERELERLGGQTDCTPSVERGSRPAAT